MSEDTLITCPAPLGMLRRGSPILWTDGRGLQHPLIVERVDGDLVKTAGSTLPWGADAQAFTMDLTDATGRAHAAWWAARVLGGRWPTQHPVWVYSAQGWKAWQLLGTSRSWLSTAQMFTHLDPTDDTRLPDGSRVVDALALKAVVEHLLGAL